MAGNPTSEAPGTKRFRYWLRKVLTIVILTVAFGWFYGWASPWAFPKDEPADFKYGLLEGALMPMSLPTLVMGKNVAIYADSNTGRGYKIGYICGLNVCGLIFIGGLFRRPKIKETIPDKSQ